LTFFLSYSGHHRALHSFPTRRSSDLSSVTSALNPPSTQPRLTRLSPNRSCLRLEISSKFACSNSSRKGQPCDAQSSPYPQFLPPDRKSTRLNSSHVAISYAVFCLKKK